MKEISKRSVNFNENNHKFFKRWINTISYSIDGFFAAWGETSFRQLVLLNIVSLPILFFIDRPILFKLLILTVSIFCLIVELLNTAIEATVDYISTERHPLAKIAKDTGSAAQFSTLILLTILWLFFLFY